MRTRLFTATAAAALLAAGAALAQAGQGAGGQPDAHSNKPMNSSHANAPGAPGGMQDQSGAGMQDQDRDRGGMENTSAGDNERDRDRDRDNDRTNVRVKTGEGVDRVRINENGNRTNVRITTTQRTRIRDVLVRAHGPRLTHVTFRVGVGARIPRTVRVAVLPPEIVTIAPQWAGFSYFVYGGEIVIVDPASFAIMATLPL